MSNGQPIGGSLHLQRQQEDKVNIRVLSPVTLKGETKSREQNSPQLQLYIRPSPLTSQTQICTWCPHMQTFLGLSFLMHRCRKDRTNIISSLILTATVCLRDLKLFSNKYLPF